MHSSVSIQIVTFENEKTILSCLRSLLCLEGFTFRSPPLTSTPVQDHSGEPGSPSAPPPDPSLPLLRIRIWENASRDRTREVIEDFLLGLPAETRGAFSLICSPDNLGFCGGHNHLFSHSLSEGSEYVLLINPDLGLAPQALRQLFDVLQFDTQAGAATPKLLRADTDLRPLQPQIIDSSGIIMTPEIRHFDRGAGEEDKGQFETQEYVFGATGACVLIRMSCLLDVCLPQAEVTKTPLPASLPIFDDAFFAYREDADLSWRMLWLGWKTRYHPPALGYHIRRVTPERRSELPQELNAWSVRNRFLMQIANFSFLSVGLGGLFALFRNLLVVAAVLLKERTSIPALKEVLHLFPRALSRRREIFRRRRTSLLNMHPWFSFRGASQPALPLSHSAIPALSSVHAVIVAFGTGEMALNCASTLLEGSSELPQRLSIEILDNTPRGETGALEELPQELSSRVILTRTPENLGFAGAVNRALGNTDADALLILNPDVSIQGQQVQLLLDQLNKYPNLEAVAPVLSNPDGSPQEHFTARRLPSLASTLAELFLLHRLAPLNIWTSNYLLSDEVFYSCYLHRRNLLGNVPQVQFAEPYFVEQPAGACLLLRSSSARALSGFDTRFYPAWFEDVDYCKRLKERGGALALIHVGEVQHQGGVTKDLLPSQAFLSYWYGNMRKYWRKHGSPLEIAILQLALPVALLLRSGFYFLQGLLLLLSSRRTSAEPSFRLALDLLLVIRNVYLPVS